MVALRPAIGMLVASWVMFASATAEAANYTVEFCIEYATDFDDKAGGDYWDTDSNRVAHGINLFVQQSTTPWDTKWTGPVDEDGCKTLTLSDSHDYFIVSTSLAEVSGVDITVYADDANPGVLAGIWVWWSLTYPFDPALSDLSETMLVPFDTATAMLAVGSKIIHRNNMGLGSLTPLDFYDDECCSVTDDGEIHASTASQTAIAHETGHGIGFARDTAPNFEYTAAEDGCDGDDVDLDSHGQVSKEWQSAAAVEGFADTVSMWMFNDMTEADCSYNRHYFSDFDLDGAVDNAAGDEGIMNGRDPSEPTLREVLRIVGVGRSRSSSALRSDRGRDLVAADGPDVAAVRRRGGRLPGAARRRGCEHERRS